MCGGWPPGGHACYLVTCQTSDTTSPCPHISHPVSGLIGPGFDLNPVLSPLMATHHSLEPRASIGVESHRSLSRASSNRSTSQE